MTATPYVKQAWIDGDTTKPTSAARLGVIETGIFDAHYRPSVAVYHSAGVSIPNNADTAVVFDTESYDTDSMHSTVSNTARLVAPVAGKYDIKGRLAFNANATGLRYLKIRLNGTTVIDWDAENSPTAGQTTFLGVARDSLMSASDYVELLAFQNSGGALGTGSGPALIHFEMHLVSY